MGDGRQGERPRGGSSLGAQVQELEKRVRDLAQEVRSLKGLLRLKDNSSTLLASLIGQQVAIDFTDGSEAAGTLRWVDKYNYGVQWIGSGPVFSVNKGAVRQIGSHAGGEQ